MVFTGGRVVVNELLEDLRPGVLIGSGGSLLPLGPTPTIATVTAPYDMSPPKPIETWGLDMTSSHLLAGLSPWPKNPPLEDNQPALSSLGHFADNVYDFGPMDMTSYRTALEEFADVAFPRKISEKLKDGLDRYLSRERGNATGWRADKYVWQTDKDTHLQDTREVGSWKSGKAIDEGWTWELLTDKGANKWLKGQMAHSRIAELWDALPSGILVSLNHH
jgi:alpha 1,6-mannosyltransferase